uniref:Sushi domain containing 1 n=1 Tax=Gopherus agassizii TaxID=38772 RepID=A0A452IH19_9SAUR
MQFYAPGELVTLSCPAGYRPSPPVIKCVRNGSQAVWSETPTCQQEKCEISRTWDSGLQFAHEGQFYALGDSVTLNCSEGYWPSPPVIKCVRNGSQAVWSEIPACRGVCTMAGNWPSSVSAASARTEFAVGESVLVTCRPEQYEGSPAWVRCTETAGHVEWDTRNVSCVEKCKAPDTRDSRVRFALEQQFYSPGDSVTWSCPAGYQPSQPDIRCTRQGSQSVWSGTAACTEVCTRAGNWPPSVSAASPQTEFAVGEWVQVTCRPEQYEGSPAWVQCTETAGHVEWDTRNVSCVVTPRIIPGSLEISPTTIKLHWTCEPPKSCQGSWKIRAQCQLDGPLSGPCQRQRLTREQPLQGLDGTVTCSSLHPFTSYRVTIFGGYPATRSPSTVLYRQRVTTSETAPDKPEIEPLDLSTKTLKWKQLLPCKGAIIGYQLNITARREYNSDFLEVKALRVNQSVTKYLLQPWRHGTNYTVTIQGLTAAGLGQASHWDFETDISEPDIPTNITALSIYSISPSSGTALLPLQPFPELHGPIREYQIIVSAMQNGSEADTCRSPGLQPFNSSLERDVYLAAVLPAHNLTGPTDFVLGNGARHYGYYNAPLRPHRNYTAFVRVVSRWKQVALDSPGTLTAPLGFVSSQARS